MQGTLTLSKTSIQLNRIEYGGYILFLFGGNRKIPPVTSHGHDFGI